MKMKIRIQKPWSNILLYGSSFVILFGMGMNCARFEVAEIGASGGSSPASSTSDNSLPAVAFMSSEQILKTMISATATEGLGELTDPADDLINNTYMQRNGSLPSVNTLDQATGPTMMAVTNIASTVCAKAVDRDRATGEAQRGDRLFFNELDFSKGLSEQSSDGVTAAFARLARNAWRRDVNQDEVDTIITYAQEFSVGANATDPAQTRLLAIGVCTSVLSAIDTLTY